MLPMALHPEREGSWTQADFIEVFNARALWGLEHQPTVEEIETLLANQYPKLRRDFLSLSVLTDPRLPIALGMQRSGLQAASGVDPSSASLTCHAIKDIHCGQLLDKAAVTHKTGQHAAYGFYTDVAWTMYTVLDLIPGSEMFRRYGIDQQVDHAVRFLKSRYGKDVDRDEMIAQNTAKYLSILDLMREDRTGRGILVIDEGRNRLLKQPSRIAHYDDADLPGSTPEFIDAGTKLTRDLYRAYYSTARSLYTSFN